MYAKILVPLDGSKRAEAILRHVEPLAQKLGSKVIFLRVIKPAHTASGHEGQELAADQQTTDAQITEAQAYLAGFEGEFKAVGIPTGSRISQGSAVRVILDTAEAVDADLIAMASHGRVGLSQAFHHSVAADVLHGTSRPLLVVRSDS